MEMNNPSSNHQSNAQGSFGATLQQARKSKQISLKEAASELFILERHLQALEEEDFAALPQVTFARGFVINYAKFLQLDPTKIATSFDAAYPDEMRAQSVSNIDTPLRPMGTLQRDSRSRIRFNPLLILAIIGLIVLAVFLFRMVTNASQDNATSTTAVEDLSASEQAQGAAVDTQYDSTGLDSVGASGSALNLDSNSDISAVTLDVEVIDTTNVDITDASGNSLMSGSQTSGNYKLLGTPPFNIQIDNIDNVKLLLNQESVALNEYATDKQASFALAP
ncbi:MULTISPECIES: helix-turn-helix domain-containing protein [unclassified Psychrobacter]|uniref:helix-turn-helix domain-containing protein n=1 Tax=unclassified Psychrobacter TaxID=196806 RepID=UPI003F45FF9A